MQYSGGNKKCRLSSKKYQQTASCRYHTQVYTKGMSVENVMKGVTRVELTIELPVIMFLSL